MFGVDGKQPIAVMTDYLPLEWGLSECREIDKVISLFTIRISAQIWSAVRWFDNFDIYTVDTAANVNFHFLKRTLGISMDIDMLLCRK